MPCISLFVFDGKGKGGLRPMRSHANGFIEIEIGIEIEVPNHFDFDGDFDFDFA